MKREDKIKHKIARATKRRRKNKERFMEHRERHKYDSWADSSSPTGYSQNCEMGGICESPCNGDC